MSANERIIQRLSALADEVELRQVSVVDFRDQLLGHTEALEGVPFALVKEAQMVWGQLTAAIDKGDGLHVDVHPLGNWLREWTARVQQHWG